MANYTPGPWGLLSEGDQVWAKEGELQIANCRSSPGWGMLHDEKQIKSNARLCSAAPELLESLEVVTYELNLLNAMYAYDMPPACRNKRLDEIQKAFDVIKKAKEQG